MTEYDRDDLDYELDDISDRLEELKEDEKEYGRFISDDLEILSDYYDLMEDEGLTEAEFNKYKAQCIHRLKTKKYVSALDVNVKALKFAHNLCKLGCLTKQEYEMVKKRIELLSQEKKQPIALLDNNYNSSGKNVETEGEEYQEDEEVIKEELNCLWELIKSVLYILSIPFRFIYWLLEIAAFGYKDVWKRDELERIMNKRNNDD